MASSGAPLRRPDGNWQVQGWGDVYSVTGALSGAQTDHGQLALANTDDGLQVVALAQGKPWHVVRNSAGSWSQWADVTGVAGQIAPLTTVGAAGAGVGLNVTVAGAGKLSETTRDGTTGKWSAWSTVATGNGTGSSTTQAFRPMGSTNTPTAAPNTGGGTGGPHALLSSTTTTPTGSKAVSYQYDAKGRTTAITDTGGTATLAWNGEDKLASYARTGQAGATTYLYDADGNPLIRRSPGKTTLFLPTDELTLDTATGSMSNVRSISAGGGLTFTRVTAPIGGGTVLIQAADPHGTNSVQINTDAAQTVTRRDTDPFGNLRGTQPTAGQWAGTKGFVGGTKDDTTGLTNLGARQYDPTTGRFINPDPILDAADPQQWNGYAYSNNNPVNLSDPSGLHFEECSNGMYTCSGGITPIEKGRDYDQIVEENKKTEQFQAYSAYSYWRTHKTLREQYATKCSNGRCNPNSKEGHEGNNRDFLFGLGTIVVAPLDLVHTVIHLGDHEYSKPGPMATYIDWAQGHGLDPQSAHFVSGAYAPAAVGDAYAANPEVPQGWCNSFPAGTKVLLADGTTKPIEQLTIGDQVTATDPQTGDTAGERVTKTIITPDDKDFTDLQLTTAVEANPAAVPSTITSTQHHPYWDVTTKRWTDAADLQAGHQLLTPAGDTVTVASVRNYHTDSTSAYNLTVSQLHTYYVLTGATPILVHNCGDTPPGVQCVCLPGTGTGPADVAIRNSGPWTRSDIIRGSLGLRPNQVGSRMEIHHADQMPGSAIHELDQSVHRGAGTDLHRNPHNQGVTKDMRKEDTQLHWWYRSQEQGWGTYSPDHWFDNWAE
ncbi:RHS repeat-associated core domain-containing protein [Streptomyces sp. 1331.2]|uniref:RHS repeat-associated core domain-containing protein n=1 Tax=Streptomyces sp. 1331.2 TaxID=1938835 RepID=UPI000BE2E5CA|nr:RHS repeat-associated core domain-containing protein [Streptomyces sp. 1331.2]